ncbi:hypothetical protein [Virgibacillus doumboii]|uniref:hypothetical protein n=1 Tax=Virgibacillus doumboii TaxID=2697503 RepID=UPI0013DF9B4E|nr:hypothetical protein [Virgibacillus doumboii]
MEVWILFIKTVFVKIVVFDAKDIYYDITVKKELSAITPLRKCTPLGFALNKKIYQDYYTIKTSSWKMQITESELQFPVPKTCNQPNTLFYYYNRISGAKGGRNLI